MRKKEKRLKEYREDNRDRLHTILETWLRPDIKKAKNKLARAKELDRKYKIEQLRENPCLQRGRFKIISKEAKTYRQGYQGSFEMMRAIGSSSETSDSEVGFKCNVIRPTSSTSSFDLDSDDMKAEDKELFNKYAEIKRKQSAKEKPNKCESAKVSSPGGCMAPSTAKEIESNRKSLYPDFRTHTGIKPPLPPSTVKKVLLPRVPTFPSTREEPPKTVFNPRGSYKVFADTFGSYRKMMGHIPKPKIPPASASSFKETRGESRTLLPRPSGSSIFKTSTVPKLPPINGIQKATDNSRSSGSHEKTRTAQTSTPLANALRRPNKPKLPPIWIHSEERPTGSLRIPLEDGSTQIWRPRQGSGSLFLRSPSSTNLELPRSRCSEPTPYSTDFRFSNLNLTPLEIPLTKDERQAKRQQESLARFEANRRVAQFVAPKANWDSKSPKIRPQDVLLSRDEVLAKTSFLQYYNKALMEHIRKNELLKGHLIVRVVRLGSGSSFQPAFIPGVLAWARYGKGQRIKACFMGDEVDYFIYQIGHLNYFYDDSNDTIPLPSICIPRKYR